MIYLNQNEGTITLEKILTAIELSESTEVVLLGESEWECHFGGKETVDELKQRGITLKVIHGSVKGEYYTELYNNLNLDVNQNAVFWPIFWLTRAELHLQHSDSNINHYLYSPPKLFKHHFICLNNRSHIHRCATIEELARLGLLNKGVVTWHDFLKENPNYPFKYFDRNKKMTLNDDFSTKLDSFLIPQEFHDSFFHLITEATSVVNFITEKTAIPILLKKPFAVVAAPGFHTYLQSLGFELYDEIIDYSFDNEPDMHRRVEMLVGQMKNILALDLSTAYDIIQEKAQRNYTRILEIIRDDSFIPNEIKQLDRLYRNDPELGHEYSYYINNTKKINAISIWNEYDTFINITDQTIQEKNEISYFLVDSCNEMDAPFQPHHPLTDCVKKLNDSNIPIKMLTMSDTEIHSSWREQAVKGPWCSVELIDWPLYWLSRTFRCMANDDSAQLNKLKNLDIFNSQVCLDNDHYDFLFVSLNNITKKHRCEMMDQLAKYDLITSGAISWRDFVHADDVSVTGPPGNSINYDFKYWNPSRILLDQPNVDQRTVLFSQETMVEEYRTSFAQVVPETDEQLIFISEKTAVPLFFNKPFLVAGAANHHLALERFGFKLYDEIFDYSFDSCEDITLRYHGIAENLNNIRHCNLLELREKIKDKLIYNRNLALSYVFDRVPEQVRTIDVNLRSKQKALLEFQACVNIGYLRNELY